MHVQAGMLQLESSHLCSSEHEADAEGHQTARKSTHPPTPYISTYPISIEHNIIDNGVILILTCPMYLKKMCECVYMDGSQVMLIVLFFGCGVLLLLFLVIGNCLQMDNTTPCQCLKVLHLAFQSSLWIR